MNLRPVKVTDHCIVRYLERVLGMDVEKVREQITDICGGSAAIGATAHRWEGFRFEIDQGTIVTVVPDQQRPSKTTRNRAQDRISERA